MGEPQKDLSYIALRSPYNVPLHATDILSKQSHNLQKETNGTKYE
jgi:hypothetical protein